MQFNPLTIISLVNDTLEMDTFSGFFKAQKKKIILPLSETLKYMGNSQLDINDKLNLNSFPIDIKREKNIKLLDVFNYDTFINADQPKSNNNDHVSIYIKLIITESYIFIVH